MLTAVLTPMFIGFLSPYSILPTSFNGFLAGDWTHTALPFKKKKLLLTVELLWANAALKHHSGMV